MSKLGPKSEPSEAWSGLKEIYSRAMELPVTERMGFVCASLAGGDERESLMQLIECEWAAGEFFVKLRQEIETFSSPQPMLSIGDLLADRFEIVRFIAGGGMGEVYEAEDQELGGRLALKVMNPSLDLVTGILQRFREEIRLARTVNSLHICRVYDVARHQGTGRELLFFTMELLDGQTLSERLASSGPLQIEEAEIVAAQLLEGLNSAHKVGVLHRDLKSSNVILCGSAQSRRVVITDFGLSRAVAASPASLELPDGSTPAYAAPERVAHAADTVQADIYSLGVVLHEMTTGELPHAGTAINCPDLAIAIRRLPKRWQSTIRRCLEPLPESRFQDVERVVHALGFNSRRQNLTRRTLITTAITTTAAGAIWWTLQNRANRIDSVSIAVMPFDVRDSSIRYLADGVTDRLTDALTQVPGLKVVARTAVQRLPTSTSRLIEIAKQFNVRYLLSGSLQGNGPYLRIPFELIEASTGFQVCSGTQDIDKNQIEGVSRTISRTLIRALKLDLKPVEMDALDKKITTNPVAYQAYLLGRYYASSRTQESLEDSIVEFDRATRLDARFSAAYAALGYAWFDLSMRRGGSWHEASIQSLAAAYKAIEIDRGEAEAYVVLASNQDIWQWDWRSAEANFIRAIRLNPQMNGGHSEYASLLGRLGRENEGLHETALALELDPLNSSIQVQRGTLLQYAGRLDESLDQFAAVLRADPGYVNVYSPLADTLAMKGRLNDAIEASERALALSGRASFAIASLARLCAVTNQLARAQELLKEVESLYEKGNAQATEIGFVYFGLGKIELGFDWLERAYKARDPDITAIKVAYELKPLHSDARYRNLLQRMNLN